MRFIKNVYQNYWRKIFSARSSQPRETKLLLLQQQVPRSNSCKSGRCTLTRCMDRAHAYAIYKCIYMVGHSHHRQILMVMDFKFRHWDWWLYWDMKFGFPSAFVPLCSWACADGHLRGEKNTCLCLLFNLPPASKTKILFSCQIAGIFKVFQTLILTGIMVKRLVS